MFSECNPLATTLLISRAGAFELETQNVIRLKFLLLALLALSLCFASVVRPSMASGSPNAVWEHDFGENISGMTVADGKVFVLLYHGDLYCLDQQTGNVTWSYSLGGYLMRWDGQPLISVDAGKVFAISVSPSGKSLNCFDENSGQFLWQYISQTSGPPPFTAANGKVLIDGKVLNGTDGQVLWDSRSHPDFNGGFTFIDNRVLVGSGSTVNDTLHLNSVNPDNGQVLWSTKISTPLDTLPVVADGRVIIWSPNTYQIMLCLNETDGSFLWSSDAGARSSLQRSLPAVADGLVVFGGSDGYLYALNEQDGTLRWRFYQANLTVAQLVGPAIANNHVFIGTQGHVYSLNEEDGAVAWNTTLSADSIYVSPQNHLLYATAGTAPTDVTAASDLYSLSMEDGSIQWTQHFIYWVLQPVSAGNKVFVAADLKAIAYTKPIIPEFPNTVLFALPFTAIAVIAIFFRLKTRRNNHGNRGNFE